MTESENVANEKRKKEAKAFRDTKKEKKIIKEVKCLNGNKVIILRRSESGAVYSVYAGKPTKEELVNLPSEAKARKEI